MGLVSKSFGAMGPMAVQVTVGIGLSLAFAQGMTLTFYKKNREETRTSEWRAQAKTMPAPLKDPQGKLNQ